MQENTKPIVEYFDCFINVVKEYFLFIFIAFFAGLCRWAEGESHTMFSLFKELIVAGFSGTLAMLIVNDINMTTMPKGFLVGVCAHMGPKIMDRFEKKAQRWLD